MGGQKTYIIYRFSSSFQRGSSLCSSIYFPPKTQIFLNILEVVAYAIKWGKKAVMMYLTDVMEIIRIEIFNRIHIDIVYLVRAIEEPTILVKVKSILLDDKEG